MKEAILEPILRKMRLNKILPHLNEFNNPRVLDIGCGWEARLLREIEPFISLGVGIDFKAPNIKTDKLNIFPYYFEKKIDSVTHSANMAIWWGQNESSENLVHLPFENETFEVVTMLAVIEHLNYPIKILKEISIVLVPNGILLLTAPSHIAKPVLEFLSYKLKIVSEAEIRDHKRYYNKRDLSESIAKVKELEMLIHNYFQCGMNNFVKVKKRKM